jgi:hypothetical protein
LINSAFPSSISTNGGTTVTLLGTNLCRRHVSIAIERSSATISLISNNYIVFRSPAGLSRRPFLNLSFLVLGCVALVLSPVYYFQILMRLFAQAKQHDRRDVCRAKSHFLWYRHI